MKTGSNPGPVPARALAVIVFDTIKIGSPAGSGLRGAILEGLEKVVWNEHLGLQAGHCRGLEGTTCGSRGFLRFTVPLVIPGSPAKEFPAEIGNENRQFVTQRRDLVLEIDGKIGGLSLYYTYFCPLMGSKIISLIC